jgi:polysaccharide pyruvyl transferase WcaK-like protein
MNISIYGHGGSSNHGNEAIVRGICGLFPNQDITLYSFIPEVDKKFGLDQICSIKLHRRYYSFFSIDHIITSFLYRFFRKKTLYFKYIFTSFLKNVKGTYLLEAGDQYCENDMLRNMYAYLNKEINKRGGKTVMLGCTINEEYLLNNKVIKDLQRYSLIIARESITYNALIEAGVNKNSKLAPCPAFIMESSYVNLPFKEDFICINAGFLSQNNQKYYDLLIENCEKLIDYIICQTHYNIALIPHVNWNEEQSDFNALNTIFEKFKYSNRIKVVEEHNAPQQKYVMSKCKFMIALRTHVAISSIAAQVPTLITGYKVKSTGIAYDIFPHKMKVLMHIQSLKSNNDFINAFKWLLENETEIRNYMKIAIPNYIKNVDIIREEIIKL